MKYNPAGEIVNVTVSLVLGFVREAALHLEQEFHVTFVQVVFFSKWENLSSAILRSELLVVQLSR